VRLALTLANGDVLLGDETDVQRLLKFASGFGASQPGVEITRRTTTVAGVDEAVETARWINATHVVSISEVPDA